MSTELCERIDSRGVKLTVYDSSAGCQILLETENASLKFLVDDLLAETIVEAFSLSRNLAVNFELTEMG